MPSTLGQRVLERATEQLGETQLAIRLGISRTTLRALMAGLRPVPDSILLKAVDVIMSDPTDPVPPAADPPNEKPPKPRS